MEHNLSEDGFRLVRAGLFTRDGADRTLAELRRKIQVAFPVP